MSCGSIWVIWCEIPYKYERNFVKGAETIGVNYFETIEYNILSKLSSLNLKREFWSLIHRNYLFTMNGTILFKIKIKTDCSTGYLIQWWYLSLFLTNSKLTQKYTRITHTQYVTFKPIQHNFTSIHDFKYWTPTVIAQCECSTGISVNVQCECEWTDAIMMTSIKIGN